jgi:hypothetical protein
VVAVKQKDIHECSHHASMAHGRDFHAELEKLAGRAARIMFAWSQFIEHEYGSLMESPG